METVPYRVNPPLVSVVIPAYNAVATLQETLDSVLGQTYRQLEVVIVDDGSVDGTWDLAAAAAMHDPRVRLIRQANAGVAAARNRGIAATSGTFVAFVDADDLWARDKICRQIAALEDAGDDTALCYTWFVDVDAKGAVRRPGLRPPYRGAVLEVLCQYNFVGNGSSMLVRRTALDCTGGFDVSLHARGAQGCEDYDLLLRLAEKYRFALVADHLVGYRNRAGAMSNDHVKMGRSWRLVAEQAVRRRPDLDPFLVKGRINYAVYLITAALLHGRVIKAARLARQFEAPLQRLARPVWSAMWLTTRQAAAKTIRGRLGAPRRFGDDAAELPGTETLDPGNGRGQQPKPMAW